MNPAKKQKMAEEFFKILQPSYTFN